MYFSVGTHNLNFVSHCVLTREEVRRQRARASSQDKKNGVNIDTTFSFYAMLFYAVVHVPPTQLNEVFLSVLTPFSLPCEQLERL